MNSETLNTLNSYSKNKYKYGFVTEIDDEKPKKGLNEDTIKFISLKKGYHGTHFGGASVNGNNRFRINYEPLLPGCFHLPSPYTYRNPFNETNSSKLAHHIAAAFEDEIAFQGANSIAAFIMEPIQGAGGVIIPDPIFMTLMPVSYTHLTLPTNREV